MSKEIKPYKYFSTPDGEEVLEKLWYVSKPSFFASLGVATCDVLLHSYPKGYLQIIGRYLYITGPLMAASTTFVVMTNVAGSIRKKDDPYNWAVGGYAAGGIIGAWRGSIGTGLLIGTALALLGMGKKYSVECNYTLFPDFVPKYGGALAVQNDYTLTQERPKNYITGLEK